MVQRFLVGGLMLVPSVPQPAATTSPARLRHKRIRVWSG